MTRNPDLIRMLDAIDRLRKQHRAGIYPNHGQVEELFDAADVVRLQLSSPAPESSRDADDPLIGWGADVPPAAPVTDRVLLDAGDRRMCLVLELPPGTKVFAPSSGVREIRSGTQR